MPMMLAFSVALGDRLRVARYQLDRSQLAFDATVWVGFNVGTTVTGVISDELVFDGSRRAGHRQNSGRYRPAI